jgi:tetratricopeptide (TPR) repeat protein
MLKALREHTVPGEQAAVFAGPDMSSAIPAYRVTLIPILFREDLRGPKGRDVVGFLDTVLMTNTQLEILNKYQVKYLLISGERESVSQCDLLPEYFQPLFRNSYGALYRVALPLESNALIEANTVANYGEWEGAIQAYDAVLAAEPDNSLAHTGLGMILQFLGKPKAAVREFEAAVRTAPTNAQAHAHLVHLYRQLGMNDQAAAHIPAAGRLMESEPK